MINFEPLEMRLMACTDDPVATTDDPPGDVSIQNPQVVPAAIIGPAAAFDIVIADIVIQGTDIQQACYQVNIMVDGVENSEVTMLCEDTTIHINQVVPHGDGIHVILVHLEEIVKWGYSFVIDTAGVGITPSGELVP